MEQIQLTASKRVIVGVQFLFVAFGATVLVPLLVGLDPSTALLTAGLGTFIFHFLTKGKVPIFLVRALLSSLPSSLQANNGACLVLWRALLACRWFIL